MNKVERQARPPRSDTARAKHGHTVMKDGKPTVTKEYAAWQQMLNRVYKGHGRAPQANEGVNVHLPWQSDFTAFLKDVGHAPSPEHRLLRKDATLGYIPGNMQWCLTGHTKGVTITSRSTVYEYQGKPYTMRMLARMAGISPQAMMVRLRNGWSVEAAVTTPVNSTPRGRPKKGTVREYLATTPNVILREKRVAPDQ